MLSEQALYTYYDVMASSYPGWSLSEIRMMSARERRYWLALIRWKRERMQ